MSTGFKSGLQKFPFRGNVYYTSGNVTLLTGVLSFYILLLDLYCLRNDL